METFNKIRLSWVHSGARQAIMPGGKIRGILALMGVEITEEEKKDLKISISKSATIAEFSNVVFRREYIRDIRCRKRGTFPHVMYWLVNVNYLPGFEANIVSLKKRYSTLIVGKMLDYLHPKHSNRRSSAVAIWNVNIDGYSAPIEAFRECLFQINREKLQEKLTRLQAATPPGTKVNLKVALKGQKQKITDSIVTRTIGPATQHRFSSLTGM